ncbi:MAG: hemerythrin family protein [Betaproteobacteria bacterium]|nr:hemerythrin family protein [Betaproteobacteria bacterium]
MTDFKWTNVIEVGHAEIDAQHRRLLHLCTDVIERLLHSGDPKSSMSQLQELIDFTEEHFEFEEDLMRSVNYPGLDRHAKYHSLLLAELRTFVYRVHQGEGATAVGTMSFLWSWLNLHIDSMDRELTDWLGTHEPDSGARHLPS